MKVTNEANRRTMVARLQRMHEFGELDRETRRDSREQSYKGKTCTTSKFVHYFTARVKITAPLFEPTKWAADYAAAKRNDAKLDREDTHEPKPRGPWHTINRCSDKRPPIPRQGGQSSCTGFRRASIMAGLGD